MQLPTQTLPSNVQVIVDDIYDPQDQMCKDCGDKGQVVEDSKEGQMVCLRCGCVTNDRVISEGSEWRTFGDGDSSRKDDPQRTGGPESELLAELGLSTIVGNNPNLDGDNFFAKTQNRDALENRHRVLLESFMKIAQMAGRLNLPRSVVTKAQEFYKSFVDCKELKVRKGEALQAVCLYISWRLSGVPRTIKELCTATGIRKRDVSRLYSKIKKLKLHKSGKKPKVSKSPSLPPSAVFMDRFCSQLQIPRGPTNWATEITKRVAQRGLLEGKQPQTIAGAAIFMVCQLAPAYKKTFQDIADVSGMGPSTLRQAYHVLHQHRLELVPEECAPKATVEALLASSPEF